jgi:hypothetical protein
MIVVEEQATNKATLQQRGQHGSVSLLSMFGFA